MKDINEKYFKLKIKSEKRESIKTTEENENKIRDDWMECGPIIIVNESASSPTTHYHQQKQSIFDANE